MTQLLDITFGDAEEALVGWLRGRLGLPDLAGGLNAVDVAAPSTSLTGTQRCVQVELAGTPTQTRVLEFATVRLVAWAAKGKRHDVKALASTVRSQALLLAGTADVFGVSPLVGRSSVAVDPDTKNLSCWVTVRVALRPRQT